MYQLQELLSKCGIHLNDEKSQHLQEYINLLLDWNKKVNLISRKDESRIIENQILESFAFLLSYKIKDSEKIIDVGSGAGLPALPISLMCPYANFFLIESRRLKALFLKEVVDQLHLSNVNVICDRIENISKDEKYHQFFDLGFSRAVGSLKEVYNWICDLIKPGGFYIAWKGGSVQQEIYEMKKDFKSSVVDVVKMDTRLIDANREKVFVQVQKIISNEEE